MATPQTYLKGPEGTCHGCGLEDVDTCVKGEHNPAISLTKAPCRNCTRGGRIPNAKEDQRQFKDRWNERWTIDSDGKRFIED